MKKHTIKASIDVHAPPETVWRVLMDFPRYPDWSKFLLSIEGRAIPGSYLRVLFKTTAGRSHVLKPLVLQVAPPRTFLCHLGVSGVFDGEHGFTLEYQLGGHTRVRQMGEFAGLLLPVLWRRFDPPASRGFTAFNRALKKVAEAQI